MLTISCTIKLINTTTAIPVVQSRIYYILYLYTNVVKFLYQHLRPRRSLIQFTCTSFISYVYYLLLHQGKIIKTGFIQCQSRITTSIFHVRCSNKLFTSVASFTFKTHLLKCHIQINSQ